MTGLELADAMGIKSMEARHAFAHDIANKMIANYSPANRPEIFQGALGAPIGLFQSFVMNYYQRIFRYVETKDWKALSTQLATQSGLFGRYESARLAAGDRCVRQRGWAGFGVQHLAAHGRERR